MSLRPKYFIEGYIDTLTKDKVEAISIDGIGNEIVQIVYSLDTDVQDVREMMSDKVDLTIPEHDILMTVLSCRYVELRLVACFKVNKATSSWNCDIYLEVDDGRVVASVKIANIDISGVVTDLSCNTIYSIFDDFMVKSGTIDYGVIIMEK